MFGYVEFYFKVENETDVAYCKYDSDFSKSLTEEWYTDKLMQGVKKLYEQNNIKVDKISSCTKEEYLISKGSSFVSISFNDSGIKIAEAASEGYVGKFTGIEFVQLKASEHYIFIVNDENWNFDEVKKWMKSISESLPDIKFSFVLKSMLNIIYNTNEYTTLKQILQLNPICKEDEL